MRAFGFVLAILCAACSGGSSGTTVRVELFALDATPAAGATATFEVRVLQADGSVAAGFTGTARLSTSDPQAAFDDAPRFTVGSDGRALLEIEFRTAGAQSFVVSVGGREASVVVDVAPAPASSFLVVVTDGQPAGKGQPMAGAVTATALDAFGNVAPDFAADGDPVTLRVEPSSIDIAGLQGANEDTLLSANDFVDGVATLHGRAVLLGFAGAARLVLESAGGVAGTSGSFSIDPIGPVPAAAARLLDVNRDGTIDQGDRLILAFDEDVVVNGATAGDIALSDPADDLGAGAAVAQGPASNELQITLGASPSLRPEGLASGIAVATTSAIVSAAIGAPVRNAAPADVVPFPLQGPTFTTTGSLYGVASGDFDGDGDLDLAVAAFGGNGRVFLNDGSAGFTQRAQITVPMGQGRVAAGDLDGDGDIDLAFTDYNGVRIFLNDGAAAFTSAGTLRAPSGVAASFVTDVVLGDLDNDGDLDLIVVNGNVDQVIFGNDGSANFTYRDDVGSGYCSRAELHDFDGDGFLDIVLATVVAGANGVETNAVDEVWRNDGTGRFSKQAEYGEVQRTWGLAVGDLDGDGEADIVAGDQDDIRIYRNDGGGAAFSHVATLDSRSFPFEIRLADLDGDGHLDILSMRGFWMNEGDGRTFRFVAELTPRPRGRGSLITGDFDGDGRDDIVVVNSRVENQSGSPSVVYFGAIMRK